MPLIFGEPLPWFVARSPANERYHVSSVGGYYIVLAFIGSAKDGVGKAFWEALLRHRKPYDDSKVCGFVVSSDPADESQGRLTNHLPGIRIFWDFDQSISAQCKAFRPSGKEKDGKDFIPHVLVLDTRLRVLQSVVLNEKNATDIPKQLERYLTKLPAIGEPSPAEVQAPVLLIPNIFEPDFCRQLIEYYEKEGGLDSGFMREIDGKTVGQYDYTVKRRADCTIHDTQLLSQARARLKRRLIPEIKKAFQFEVTHIERYIVACYEGETGGFFRRHRDNTSKGTAHRKFAVTINLNAEDYEGGNLRFPEFGPHLYRAPTGGAVVFSCALLHEATPVTQGVRYAFLPFMYDEAGAEIREKNFQYLAESDPPPDAKALKSRK
jgi:hypothetical protein